MEIPIFYLWILISLLIPIVLLIIGVIKYLEDNKLSKILPTLFVVFAGYIFIALVSALPVGGMMNALAHAKADHILDLDEQIFFAFLIFGYAFSGVLLCLYASGKFLKSWQSFKSDSKNPESIFQSK